MRLINYSKVRRSAATDLKKYERLGVKMFTDALKLQAKPNPSPLPMQEAYVKFYQTVFVDSAKKEFDRIRQDNREKAYVPDDFFLNTWKEWIREWVLQNLGGLIKDVNDNTLKQIQEVLAEGIEQGLNPFQLEKLLFDQIPNINRARAIARTESTRAYNEGKKKSAQDWANQTGTILWKLWIHGGSKEPRFQHIQAQDKPIRADQPFVFTTKGVEVFMDKPGDVNGGAAQTINCSCVVVYVSEAYARRNFPDVFTNLPPLVRPSAPITPITTPIIPPQLGAFKYANTISEAKEIAKNIINKNTVLKVFTPELSQDITLNQLNRYNFQLNKLSLDYKLSPHLGDYPINLKYKSDSTSYGWVTSTDYKIYEINFGHQTDGSARLVNRVYKDEFGYERFAAKSKVDESNLDIATLTHEFAHVISVRNKTMEAKYGELKMFWSELGKIKKSYLKDINDQDKIESVFLGKYASTNENEFMAEAFTEYKLSSNPSKYALEVGKLIDFYFKK